MFPEGNTPKTDPTSGEREIAIEDNRRKPRFGVVMLGDIYSDEFRSLTGAAIRVYVILLTYMGRKTGEAYPKQSSIARIAGVQRETVSRAVQKLVGAGLISVCEKRNRMVYAIETPPSQRQEE